MNRRDFLKRSAGVALAISGLEAWHTAHDDAYLAGADPVEAVEAADAVTPVAPITGGATLSTLDNILRELYLPPIVEQLNAPFPARHICGQLYDIHFFNADGRIVRPRNDRDTWGFILVAACPSCREADRFADSSFHYMNVEIPGTVSAQRGFFPTVRAELDAKVPEFHDHLWQPQWTLTTEPGAVYQYTPLRRKAA